MAYVAVPAKRVRELAEKKLNHISESRKRRLNEAIELRRTIRKEHNRKLKTSCLYRLIKGKRLSISREAIIKDLKSSHGIGCSEHHLITKVWYSKHEEHVTKLKILAEENLDGTMYLTQEDWGDLVL